MWKILVLLIPLFLIISCGDSTNDLIDDKCTENSYYQCLRGDIYWFDSCDVLEDIKETCTETQICKDINNFSSICEENPIDDICINNSACKDNFSGIKINEITENNIFYVDPINGNDDDNGSIDMPWKDLQTVLDSKIETKKYNSLPYSDTSTLVDKNVGAPVKSGDVIILKSGDYGTVLVYL